MRGLEMSVPGAKAPDPPPAPELDPVLSELPRELPEELLTPAEFPPDADVDPVWRPKPLPKLLFSPWPVPLPPPEPLPARLLVPGRRWKFGGVTLARENPAPPLVEGITWV